MSAGSREWIEAVADEGSWSSWDVAPSPPESAEYAATLERARARTGVDESIVTGRATIGGTPVAVVASEFGFLGGSVGLAASKRLIAAFERARAERLPVVASTASGGTRMQDGTAGFLAMRDITRAVLDYRSAGLPYLVHMRHPTTGGVLASWGSYADDVSGEPGALIGFLGPRVAEGLGSSVPEPVQRAETLLDEGLLDAVVDAAGFRARAIAILSVVLRGGAGGGAAAAAAAAAVPAVAQSLAAGRPGAGAGGGDAVGSVLDAGSALGFPPGSPRSDARAEGASGATPAEESWAAVESAAAPGRPALHEFLAALGVLGPVVERRRGSGCLVTAWASLEGEPVLVVGQDHGLGARTSVEDLVLARQSFAIADRLRASVVTVVDTPGAPLSEDGERHGVAREVALTLAAGAALRVPSTALLLGEGTGAGAMALCGTDTIVAVDGAWLAPLPLEGAAALIHGDAGAVRRVAEAQRIGARALYGDGLLDGILGADGSISLRRGISTRSARLAESVLRATAGMRSPGGRDGAPQETAGDADDAAFAASGLPSSDAVGGAPTERTVPTAVAAA